MPTEGRVVVKLNLEVDQLKPIICQGPWNIGGAKNYRDPLGTQCKFHTNCIVDTQSCWQSLE